MTVLRIEPKYDRYFFQLSYIYHWGLGPVLGIINPHYEYISYTFTYSQNKDLNDTLQTPPSLSLSIRDNKCNLKKIEDVLVIQCTYKSSVTQCNLAK